MGYCFMTIQKIKDTGGLVRKYSHNYRKREITNVIPELKNQNEELIRLQDKDGNECTYLDAYKERVKSLEYYQNHRIRKGQVLAFEVVTTFSKEDHVDLDKWKEDNVEWLRETFERRPDLYGPNVISSVYHADECGNVHCHSIVLPVDENGHFNASAFTDGRAAMIQLQNSYAEKMSSHGLQRGLPGSSARHQDIKKFYTKLNQKLNVPPPMKGESAIEYRERITQLIQEERAAALRDIMVKETKSRRKTDQWFQEKRQQLNEEKAAHEKEISKKSEALDTKVLSVREQLKKMGDEKRKLDRAIHEQNQTLQKQIQQVKALGDIQNEVKQYRYQQEILDFGRKEMPELVNSIEQNFQVIEDYHQTREEIKQ